MSSGVRLFLLSVLPFLVCELIKFMSTRKLLLPQPYTQILSKTKQRGKDLSQPHQIHFIKKAKACPYTPQKILPQVPLAKASPLSIPSTKGSQDCAYLAFPIFIVEKARGKKTENQSLESNLTVSVFLWFQAVDQLH